jgi:hypothetical protein
VAVAGFGFEPVNKIDDVVEPAAGGGGNGTVVGTETVSSTSASACTAIQLVTAMLGTSKASWNSVLTACSFNVYMNSGFGVTDTCVP